MENRNVKKYLYDIKQAIDSINEYLGITLISLSIRKTNNFAVQSKENLRLSVKL